MKLFIHKCSDPQMWYATLVGKYVEFLWEDSEGFWSREPAGYTNVIKRTDAKVIAE